MMKTIELFAGARSFSLVAQELGHKTFTTDYEEIDGQDLVADVRRLVANDFPYEPDILWASPPCEGFSVASIGANWGGGGESVYTKKHNSVPIDRLGKPYSSADICVKTNMVVYREPAWCAQKSNTSPRRAIYTYDMVLQVW